MITTTGNKIVLEPVLEAPSALLVVPARMTEWGNGKLSIVGKIVAVGPKVTDAKVGEYAYHADSCFAPVFEDKYNVIRESDIMFCSPELLTAQWIGAKELPA
jgi:hypothetical protein